MHKYIQNVSKFSVNRKGGRTLLIISKGERTGENDRNIFPRLLSWFCCLLKYALIYVMKAWEKRGNKAEDNHLNLLHNSPPAVATIVSTRFSNILILSCLITILCRPVLILDPSLSLCNKLSHDCQKLQRKIRNIFSSQVSTSIIKKKLIPHKDPSIRKKKAIFLGSQAHCFTVEQEH